MRPRNVPLIYQLGVLALVALWAAPPAASAADGGVEGGRMVADRCTEFVETDGVVETYVPAARPVPEPEPLDLKAVKVADEESYKDVFRLLKEDNSCSRFFGGPAKATWVFNRFARQLRARPLDTPGVAVRMSGSYTQYRDNLTGASYRLFEDATINSNGPFVRRIPSSGARRLKIGSFVSHTRAARALVLLHELGHLVEVGGGRWLLPNDGHDASASDENTREVERHCVEQLSALRD